MTTERRLAELERRVEDVAELAAELNGELNGPTRDPHRDSVRVRLHELENVEAARRAAEAAVSALKAEASARSTSNHADAAASDRRLALVVSTFGVLIAAGSALIAAHPWG